MSLKLILNVFFPDSLMSSPGSSSTEKVCDQRWWELLSVDDVYSSDLTDPTILRLPGYKNLGGA